ncbi:MAG: CDC48 family AAA ATPase [Candidatus Altiarchaeales archaeon]|nr:CDC48 family AAA ATPase [Candidatus Altiarchaeota archaeon]MBU4341221.1 CDC48 family AAA ATPase [Candidatus Altiarchaeota archaeon]MBU4436810.1 CDC48 family AAA ATPase [Candidatus Altiarchaeota archaeon]MCG2782514.1 CDC48 family AAA ATPase [Candidatus Altiarchaeales archaeon]
MVELTLKVSEASTKDVGRGIARLDPKDMERISADVGDIVEIKGDKSTVAKVMPAFAEDRGKGIVKIDGIIRGNAQTGLGDKVRIKKVDAVDASKIVLAPTIPLHGKKAEGYLGKLLEGLPLIKGDRARTTFMGTQPREFIVVDTKPANVPVLVHSTTAIKLKTVAEEKRGVGLKISYEDIGGLGKELSRVREMIELPLKHPEIFERVGIEAPKGVLLHGPPGCGKTLIAKAIANESEAYFLHLTGPEIMAKYYGESEARLREVFEEGSKNAPSIIFLDEIDAIAPKREEVSSEKQVEKRVVSQLLALMDGLESRGEVIVIGATNIPNALDPALRRPGRFDREIGISIPDRTARLEILQIHTRGMPLADNVDLENISDLTHGFVGADMAALCREAAMSCIRKILPQVQAEEYISPEVLLELEVRMDNFLEALREVSPSVTREVFVEIPKVIWTDIGGLEEVKQELKEIIEWPTRYPKLFEYANTRPPKGILLHGPPGTGKTLLAKAVANESNANFISIKGPELMSKWVGESEKGVREVFKKAKQVSPCIVFFDEIDAMTPSRGSGAGDAHVTERVLSQLLTELDGLEELREVTVIAATNRKDLLDSALIRPGRFDMLIELPVPDKDAILQIFGVHTGGKPLGNDVNFKALAELAKKLWSKTEEDFTGADIEAVCRIASKLAIKEFINEVGKSSKKLEKPDFKIKMKHFEDALYSYKETHTESSLADEMVDDLTNG